MRKIKWMTRKRTMFSRLKQFLQKLKTFRLWFLFKNTTASIFSKDVLWVLIKLKRQIFQVMEWTKRGHSFHVATFTETFEHLACVSHMSNEDTEMIRDLSDQCNCLQLLLGKYPMGIVHYKYLLTFYNVMNISHTFL